MTPRGWDAKFCTFGTLLCLWILAFITTDSHFQYWPSKLFTKPRPLRPPRCLQKYFWSQILPDLGMLGPAWGPLWAPPLGPCPGSLQAPNQPLPRTELCLVYGHNLGCGLGRLHCVFWSTLVLQTDLEIWTVGIDICDLTLYCWLQSVAIHTFPIFFSINFGNNSVRVALFLRHEFP